VLLFLFDIAFSDKGLEILAFPCNNFGSQEPGTNEEILAFTKSQGVTFPVIGKLECDNGDKTHPVYQYLKSSVSGWSGAGLKWNFAKFLCDANGKPVKRYLPVTNPLSIEDDILAVIEGRLK
jgi:glutathione peroxidase-family protein